MFMHNIITITARTTVYPCPYRYDRNGLSVPFTTHLSTDGEAVNVTPLRECAEGMILWLHSGPGYLALSRWSDWLVVC